MNNKKLAALALALGFAWVAQTSQAATVTLLTWRFDNGSTTIAPDDVDNDDNFLTLFNNSFAVGSFSLRDTGPVSNPSAGGTLLMTGGVARGSGWSDANGNAFQFQISIAPGVQITFEKGEFYDTVSDSRTPRTWNVSIGGQAFGTGPTHVGFPNNLFDPADITLGVGVYDVMIAASGLDGPLDFDFAATREWTIDKFLLQGTITGTPTGPPPAPVPLPAAAWLLISGIAGLGALRRRRSA